MLAVDTKNIYSNSENSLQILAFSEGKVGLASAYSIGFLASMINMVALRARVTTSALSLLFTLSALSLLSLFALSLLSLSLYFSLYLSFYCFLSIAIFLSIAHSNTHICISQMIAFFARVEKYCFLSCLLNKTELRFTDFWVRCENISLNIPKGKLFPYIIYMIHVKVATFTVSFRLQSLKMDVDFGLRRLRKLEPSLSFGLRRLRKLVRVSIPICAGCASQPESQFRFAQLAQVSPDVSSDLRKLRKLEPTTISDLRKRNPSKPTVISDGRQQYPVKQNISSDFHRKKCTNGNIYFKRFKIKI